ncbi:GntR family transcriptional regulator [Christensenella massiliensis]|uniref:GntR family transcriptional regulator n=1 Tax=Christensenella massiliensis TaxID=1805714 RepID=A0AAU8A5I4_9FIRM
MTVLTLDPESKTPIYLQIVQEMKTLVMTGKLHPHEQIPSVRKTAKSLAVNPNTVQKAYAALEREGILYSVTGKGDFVADNAARIKEMRKQEIREMFQRVTREARDSGLWIDEIFSIVDEAYSGR